MPSPYSLSPSSEASSQTNSHYETHEHDERCGPHDLQSPHSTEILATASNTDLHARLEALTKDNEEAKEEIAQKQAIINHLTNSKTAESEVEQKVVKLQEEISFLRKKLVELTEDGEHCRNELRKALETISDQATYETITTTSRRSALAEDDSRRRNTAAIRSQNLIDLSDHGEKSADAAAASRSATSEEDDDLMSDFDDVLGIGVRKTHPKPAANLYSDLNDFEQLPYIHHFVSGNGETNSRGSLAGPQDAPKRYASHLLKDVINNAANGGSAGLATAIDSHKGTTTASSGNKASNKPNLKAKRPELLSTDPDDSGSEVSLYGLSFEPSYNEENTHRTLTISGLPTNITLSAVLDKVRGGGIVSAQLLSTLPITGFTTARVVFLEEFSALAYEEHSQNHPIMFRGLIATVDLVHNHTWPVNYNHMHTRCLEVRRFPRSVPPAGLLTTMGHELNRPIHMQMLNNGNLILHFASIQKAGRAYGLLPRTYRSCEPHFIADPCAQPLETLLPVVIPTNPSIAGAAATRPNYEGQDSAENNPDSPPDDRSYSSGDGLSPSLLDTFNPEELEAAYRARLPQ